MAITDKKAITWMQKYLRYVDYVGAASLYLKQNQFLHKELSTKDFKPRILGHWGTVPGLNLIYANLNYLIYKHKCEILFITGPGHGAPSTLANLLAENTMGEFYKEYKNDKKGSSKLIHDFSWPHTQFPSHVTPTVPGSILEGGELGYSLSTAFGAVLDNPNLIAAVAVGDGESESGPLAAAWHSNKFLNPKTSGAVLPIVHINGFKISNPTIYASMSEKELDALFTGYGYKPLHVSGSNIEKKMIIATEKAYQIIRKTQKKARSSKKPLLKPQWPVILLHTKKGWKGVKRFNNHAIEGSFRSHGIPFGKPQTNKDEFKVVKKWLESYKINELIDKNGKPSKEVLQFVPKGQQRMGMNKHAFGGEIYKELKLPNLSKYEIKQKKRGEKTASSMKQAGKMIRDIIQLNKKDFRLFCPDEVMSNKLEDVFEVTKRGYVWPIIKNSENIAYDGRVSEMLSEHTLEGWMQGYLLTGRHGMFVSYEAFAIIIASMVDQHAKFIKQSFKVKWRKPIASAVFILSSVTWRQDHNGYSHQNPSFVSSVLQKHGKFCQIYYPADANSMIAALEETTQKKDSICVIVAGKRPEFQWLTLKEAREQAKNGIATWEWVSGKEATKNPDVVLATAGDYITQEGLFAVKMLKELCPELKVRYVNISELTALNIGDNDSKNLDTYLTKNKPVVIGYHGYVHDIEKTLWNYKKEDRFILHGYNEAGSTTTPFDMKVSNKVDCFNMAIDLIKEGSKTNKKIAKQKTKLIKQLQDKLEKHQKYICKYGNDINIFKDRKFI